MADAPTLRVCSLLQGWLLASMLGVAIGSVIGLSPSLRELLQPTLEFLRPLPAPAIIPLAIALLGLGPAMVLLVIVFGSIWAPMLSTIQGLSLIEPRLGEVSRMLGMSRSAFIWSALPDILAGLRVSVSTMRNNMFTVSYACAQRLERRRRLGQECRRYHSAQRNELPNHEDGEKAQRPNAASTNMRGGFIANLRFPGKGPPLQGRAAELTSAHSCGVGHAASCAPPLQRSAFCCIKRGHNFFSATRL
jgi:hypothetical protein